MKKICILLIICLIFSLGFTVFSEDTVVNLYINQNPVELSQPALIINDNIMVPMINTFEALGAQVFENDVITAYYLNTYVKVDVNNNNYSINGKKYTFNQFETRNNALYVPLNLLNLAFDFTIESIENNQVNLNANTIIQYKNYNDIPYKSISFDDVGVRFKIPLDWNILDEFTHGYDSNYGRISANFSSRALNDNIDLDLIMDTYKEHRIMEYKEKVTFSKSDKKIYNYLTSNVLYFTTNVNDIVTKHVIHFVSADNQVHILAFRYPSNISEKFILQVFENIMHTFYIDGSSFDKSSEHYLEFQAARKYHLKISSKAYSNMTVNEVFPLEGYFNSDEKIESLTITVSRGDEKLEFAVPVENNAFMTNIYTPFGLGKHDIKIAITPKEEKVTFDNSVPIEAPSEQLLLQYSVVNLSKYDIQYTIPTKMVQSNDRDIKSMSKLLTRKFHTDYSKARAIYDFIYEDIEILESNDVIFSAREVYEQYRGTEKEVALYLTALLRAQDIPARIIEGNNAYVTHHWVEAYLNDEWIIIDPFGDSVLIELELDTMIILPPGFNASKATYKNRYPEKIILEH